MSRRICIEAMGETDEVRRGCFDMGAPPEGFNDAVTNYR
jgi:hypothetical protein